MINLNDLRKILYAIAEYTNINCEDCRVQADTDNCPLHCDFLLDNAREAVKAIDKYMQKSSAGPYTVVDEVEFVSLIMTGG